MKLAVMQPYFMPYIGYFQLLHATDKFVLLDDVNYINKGWVNRNRILVNHAEHFITIPLHKASQNKLICDTRVADMAWQEGLLKTIEMAYKRAPMFGETFPLVEKIIHCGQKNIAAFIYHSLVETCAFLGITTKLSETSRAYQNAMLKGQDRILDICLKEQATAYLNLPGGAALYSKERFAHQGISLGFINPKPLEYRQYGKTFVPWLSVLDVMMFNPREEIKKHLAGYTIS